MALTGFDPELVRNSIDKVKNAYEELIQQIGDNMQSKFIGGLSDKWACKQAQTFFNDGFKPAVDQLITSSNDTFASVVDSMNSAAQAWASSTDAEYSPVSFSPRNVTMDTSDILENIGGVRGIDLANANSVAAQLQTIASQAQSALNNAKSAVNNCGFIGGNQEANLIESLGRIGQKISDVATDITDQSKTAIDQTVQNYSDLEGKVSEAFNGQ